jgi:hypothetical protein
MLLTPPTVHHSSYHPLPNELLQSSCGLFRVPLNDVIKVCRGYHNLVMSAPIWEFDKDVNNWEVDIKVHMLKVGQYPCIPNVHCDFVPRTPELNSYAEKMFVWIDEGPQPLFLNRQVHFPGEIKSHKDLAAIDVEGIWKPIPKHTWVGFSQLSPHRGQAATRDGWRVFCRVTHKSIVPERGYEPFLRRHCQVYLDKDYNW